MKYFLAFFIFLFSLPVIAQQEVLQRKVSLSLKNQPYETVLKELQKASGVDFSYSSNFLPAQKISVEVKEKPLEEVLEVLFGKTNLQYQLIGNQVVIARKKSRTTVSGFIKNAESGEILIGAAVYDPVSMMGTLTNNYGFYSLTLPFDTVSVVASFVGFTKSSGAATGPYASIDFQLKPSVTLNAIEITSEPGIEESPNLNAFTIPIQQVKSVPVIMGETDIIKVLQLMPGVSSSKEGTSDFIVRGGQHDQNLILLDDVPVYNVSHLFGLFSVFNPDAVNHIRMIKGGFPARYGGRLSSVVDVHLKEGNLHKYKGEASVGMLSSRFSFEGPIVKEKGSFIVSVRRSYFGYLLDQMAKTIDLSGNNGLKYVFYDLNAKVNYRISKKDRIYLGTYTGNDNFGIFFRDFDLETGTSDQSNASINWGNRINYFRWNRELGPRLFSNLILSHSTYRNKFSVAYKSINGLEEYGAKLEKGTAITDKGAKYTLDFFLNPRHHIKSGISYNAQGFTPGNIEASIFSHSEKLDIFHTDEEINTRQAVVFLEDDFKLTERLSTNLGVYSVYYSVDGASYPSVQPRVSAHYKLMKKLALKSSYSVMNQNIHLLTDPILLGLPLDNWVPVTASVKPQLAEQFTMGIEKGLPLKLEGQVEAYYKKMSNLIEYAEGTSLFEPMDWQDKISNGRGWCYGAEFLLLKQFGKTKGWASYTLSWSKRQFDGVNNGLEYFSSNDRRHDFKTTLSHKFSEKIEVSANWLYASGVPVSVPELRFSDLYGNEILYYTGRNNHRLRPLHRLDLSLTYHLNGKWASHAINFSIFNVYNRANPVGIYMEELDRSQGIRIKERSLLPIIPSISYNVKF